MLELLLALAEPELGDETDELLLDVVMLLADKWRLADVLIKDMLEPLLVLVALDLVDEIVDITNAEGVVEERMMCSKRLLCWRQ
jgi:hypothetical protein